MKQIISGADFFDFESKPEFSGKFEHPVKREKDSLDGEQKAGDVMGYLFTDVNGEQFIIGASHQIEKALTTEGAGTGDYFKITYLGKGTTSSNKPFNKFRVDQYDDEKEFLSLNKKGRVKETISKGDVGNLSDLNL